MGRPTSQNPAPGSRLQAPSSRPQAPSSRPLSVNLNRCAAFHPGDQRAFFPEIRVAKVVLSDIPALNVGLKAGSATVQFTLFPRFGSANRTSKMKRIITIRHPNFLPCTRTQKMVNIAHFPTKVPSRILPATAPTPCPACS
jgi:hypothetical protein